MLNLKHFSKGLLHNIKGVVPKLKCFQHSLACSHLKERSLIRMEGTDAASYLQGLITNDMGHLGSFGHPAAIYAMALNSRGRVLYDLLLYKLDVHSFMIECDAPARDPLIKHLNFYKLRKKVTFLPEDGWDVWCIFPKLPPPCKDDPFKLDVRAFKLDQADFPPVVKLAIKDPRLNLLGKRLLVERGTSLTEIVNNTITDSYLELRHRLGVGEGMIDFPPDDSLPLESNADLLNGVSFHKGCYVGQELTARLYHTGEIRKRLMPIFFDNDPPPPSIKPNSTIISQEGKTLGKLRSFTSPFGLALLRIEPSLKAKHLLLKDATNITLKTAIPHWWPSDRH